MKYPIDKERRKLLRSLARELAVAESNLISVSDANQGSFGFNSLIPSFARLYEEQRLAVISNTGTLIRPTEKSDYLGSVQLPQALFAHNTQQKLWQTGAGIVSGSTSFGWGGAISDNAANCNGGINISPAFSIGGSTDWLASANTNYVSLNPDVAVERMFGYNNISDWIPPRRLSGIGRTLDELIALGENSANPLLMRGIANAVGRANSATTSLYTALRENPLPQMRYDSRNKLAAQLHLVARLIASREQLGMQQQVFFVLGGGWDTHSDQQERFAPLLNGLDSAVEAFQNTIDGLNLAASTTTFTASDFGRTLTSNGNGTDHGWGGHSFVFGGAVDGGRVIGDTPSYAVTDNPDDAGEEDGSFAGRIIPRLSVNQYAATLSRWMGVFCNDRSRLHEVLVQCNHKSSRRLLINPCRHTESDKQLRAVLLFPEYILFGRSGCLEQLKQWACTGGDRHGPHVILILIKRQNWIRSRCHACHILAVF